jgi:predicted transposase/invertase (TIGR01784 family)
MTRYIDPKTDFGFKRLFGQEDSKGILKQFLFDVLELPHPIQDLTYIPPEQLPASPEDRTGIYDVYCIDTAGRRFIVEMQRGWQVYIKDRVLYYVTFPIIQQAQKGAEWRFELEPIYCIAILDFVLDDNDKKNDEASDAQYLRRIQLADVKTQKIFYDKLTFVYIELPKFKQTVTQLQTDTDRWIYLLRHMPELQDIPAELAAESFTQAFAIAREAALSPQERLQYEISLKIARDRFATLDGAHFKGLQEGREKGLQEGRKEGRKEGRDEGLKEGLQQARLEVARTMLTSGLDITLIVQVTGLPAETIATLGVSKP